MKTKSFLLFSLSVFATSLFLIIFHSQQPQSLQNIVSQTHQHIKDFQAPVILQDNLRDVKENHLVEEERYLALVGLSGHVELWHNTTVPALVTYARGYTHVEAISFIQAVANLPYTLLFYNIGLKSHSLSVISNYCNSSKCAIIDFDLEDLPSHVSEEGINAVRPLVIQHALSRTGGVIFVDLHHRWARDADELGAAWARAARGGVAAWAWRGAVTSLTHPHMFRYLGALADDFLFVQMLDARCLVLDARALPPGLMKLWVQCALTRDCIMPIGAQSVGCRFDKKPQYRYSGCHEQDASALSIVLATRAHFDEARYLMGPLRDWWRPVTPAQLAAARNTTDQAPDHTARTT